MSSVSLILASASPARLRLLQSAGVEPRVVVSDVDESALESEYVARRGFGQADSAGLSVVLAQAKALAVADQLTSGARDAQVGSGEAALATLDAETDAGLVPVMIMDTQADTETTTGSNQSLNSTVVVGADTILEFQGRSMGKPGDPETATKRLRAMSGGHGILHTGHCVVDLETREMATKSESTVVRFAELSEQEISAYVATGEPIHVAGSFTIDGIGSAFVTGIEGNFTNVVGLSVPLLRQLVGELGYNWTDFWTN